MNKDKPYSDVYVSQIAITQGKLFSKAREIFEYIDVKWFIEMYMRSDIRRLLDEANPKYAAMSSYDLGFYLNLFALHDNYKRGEDWGGFMTEWIGMVYSFYQWEYNVPSAKLIELFPLETMQRIYPALHQMGWKAAIERMNDVIK